MKSHGFTLVELMVVIGVVSLLATFVVVAYTKYQNSTYDSQAISTAASLKDAFEDYYTENQEYPSAHALRGDGHQNRTVPSQATYTSMASKLGMSVDSLTNTTMQFIPVGFSGMNIHHSDSKARIYYATRNHPDSSNAQVSRASGCDYTLQAPDESSVAAFLIIYWSNKDAKWQVVKSDNGSASASSGCSFTTL